MLDCQELRLLLLFASFFPPHRSVSITDPESNLKRTVNSPVTFLHPKAHPADYFVTMDFIKKSRNTLRTSSGKQQSFDGAKEGPAPPPYDENSANVQNAGKSVYEIEYDGGEATIGRSKR